MWASRTMASSADAKRCQGEPVESEQLNLELSGEERRCVLLRPPGGRSTGSRASFRLAWAKRDRQPADAALLHAPAHELGLFAQAAAIRPHVDEDNPAQGVGFAALHPRVAVEDHVLDGVADEARVGVVEGELVQHAGHGLADPLLQRRARTQEGFAANSCDLGEPPLVEAVSGVLFRPSSEEVGHDRRPDGEAENEGDEELKHGSRDA